MLYPEPGPGRVERPRPLPGAFTQGMAGWTWDGEDEAVGVEVVNPPFTGLFTVPTAEWHLGTDISNGAKLGGLFRRPPNDWATRATSASSSATGADVPPSGKPLPVYDPDIDSIGPDV